MIESFCWSLWFLTVFFFFCPGKDLQLLLSAPCFATVVALIPGYLNNCLVYDSSTKHIELGR